MVIRALSQEHDNSVIEYIGGLYQKEKKKTLDQLVKYFLSLYQIQYSRV